MSVLNYDISIRPKQPQLELELKLDRDTVKMQLNSYESFQTRCKPAGNVVQKVFSTAALPIAEIVRGKLQTLLGDYLDTFVGKSKDVITLSDTPVTFEGVTVTIKPSRLTVSNYQGMLMVEGEVDIQ
jgi:hypothetical protein